MAGRIGIDDVAPVVSGGRFPAKAVVGEVVPVRATVWREGHDAVAATLVVRYHGTAYPQLADGPAPQAPMQPVPIEDVVTPAPRIKPQAIPMSTGPDTRRVPRPVLPRHRRAVDLPGGRLGRPDRDLAARPSSPSSTPVRAKTELSNDLLVGARLLERAATGVPRKLRDPLIEAAEALRKPGDPFTRAGAALSAEVAELLDEYPLRELVTRGEQHGVWVDRPRPVSARGTRCSRGPPGAGTRRASRSTARSPPPPRRCPASPRWVSTWCTCRRSTRSARCTARAATTPSPPRPGDVGSPWAIGSDQGWPRRRAPQAGHDRGLRRLRRRHARSGHGGGAGPGAAVRARPSVGEGASGVVHRAARRHHRLRGEPAEEVPGHLPDQLRQRSRRHLQRGAAGGAVLDQPRRQDLSRRQSAHQAAELLGVADRPGQGERSRRAVPGRGLHPACAALRSGQTRLHPVLQRTSPGARRSGS